MSIHVLGNLINVLTETDWKKDYWLLTILHYIKNTLNCTLFKEKLYNFRHSNEFGFWFDEKTQLIYFPYDYLIFNQLYKNVFTGKSSKLFEVYE